MNTEPLIIIASLFSMSLLASIVLFKWLENTAIVNLPFGKFGGAVAGFIGVFLILQNSYESFAVPGKPPSLDIPAGYETFISELYGIGVGFPGELKFDSSIDVKFIGMIGFKERRSNMNITVAQLTGSELKELSEDEARQKIIDGSIEMVSNMFMNSELAERKKYSLSAIKGERYVIRWKPRGQTKQIITTQIVIPNFQKQAVYTFTLTTFNPDDLERDNDLFNDIMSTVKFF